MPLLQYSRVYHMLVVVVLMLFHTTRCQQYNQNMTVLEEQSVDPTVLVGVVGQGIVDIYFPDMFLHDTESIFVGSGGSDLFRLNINNGRVTTNKVLDRDQGRSEYTFLIASSTVYIKVTIKVLDVNDNTPKFSLPSLHITVPEKSGQATVPLSASVSDPDNAPNNIRQIEIISGDPNSFFQLSNRTLDNGIKYDLNLNIRPSVVLDAKIYPNFLLTLRASDGGGRSSQMTVNVTIVDSNDHAPVFTPSTYNAPVLENATVGTSVLQVTANDRDVGDNAKISYSLDNSAEGRMFNVDTNSGKISVGKQLDYESKKSYTFIVKASDHGSPIQTSTVLVSVDVVDINDNPPVINVTFMNGVEAVPEDAKPGMFVARVSVSDKDVTGDDPHVNVTLDGGLRHFALQHTNNAIYLIVVSRPLDSDVTGGQKMYTLILTATDSGTPPLQSQKRISLRILDANDNPPKFTKLVYYAQITEKSPIGSAVIQVIANDTDSGSNKLITYEILHTPSTHSNWFKIDNRTGQITTVDTIDCEVDSQPVIHVRASDNGLKQKSANATVHVTILDVNDNQPVFQTPFYNASVAESTASRTCILTVSATDPDCGVNARVTYQLVQSPHQDLLPFTINRTSGEICVQQSLDYETKQIYEFPVKAQDLDNFHTTAWVKVDVKDVNDNSPVFYPVTYNVNINQNDGAGTRLASVQATDRDSGNFGTSSITFRIASGNTAGLFAVDLVSGEVTLQGSLAGQPSSFTLTVSATDGGGLTAAQPASVIIQVASSTHRPPAFTKNLYSVTVPEDTDIGTLLLELQAVNTNPANTGISYSIESGDPANYFTINSGNGHLRTHKSLDHDTHPSVLLNVQAASGSPVTFGNTQVNVTVTDVNDNAPLFNVQGSMTIQVPENERQIYIVKATDRDSSLNGEVRYRLQNPSGMFHVDPVSGVITVNQGQHLDREHRVEYTLILVAYDLGSPSLSSNLTVNLKVRDINDNPPKFSDQYSVDVSESARLNTKLVQVSAGDPDQGNNGQVTYQLQNEGQVQVFGIFANNGWIYLQEALNREAKDQYRLRVTAVDNGNIQLSSTVSVVINVQDANDNAPIFTGSRRFSINENMASNNVVGTAVANDLDLGANGDVTYSLDPGSDEFNIHPSTGVITTAVKLDREKVEQYLLTVVASDQGDNPKSSTATFTIRVLDLNDNKPTFLQDGVYKKSFMENQPKGSAVIKVSAIDPDAAENGTVYYYFDRSNHQTVQERFQINSDGWIVSKETLDREERGQYRINVVASDKGTPRLQSNKTVIIEVADMNEPPNATRYVTMITREGIPTNTVIGKVNVVDQDAGANGRILFFLKFSLPQNMYTFAVNYSTGEIYNTRDVDYEVASKYVLIIKVLDSNILNPIELLVNVTVIVQDENDNTPTFPDSLVLFSVGEDEVPGRKVHTFHATDKDSTTNGAIKYSIVSQEPAPYFSINAHTGDLSVIKALDRESLMEVILSIRATDQASLLSARRHKTITAIAKISDVNDNSPVFNSSSTSYVMEDEPVTFPILHVYAEDYDGGDNGNVSYAIVSGNNDGFFAIRQYSGLLTIARPLDVDCNTCKQQHNLNVTASDHGVPRRTSWEVLTIYIIDVNDNPPRFPQTTYKARVSENRPAGERVVDILAVDNDKGAQNGKLFYLIPRGIADDKFTVNSSTGRVVTSDRLDRESKSSYIITAYVRDGGSPEKYDTATIIVDVTDTNDHDPGFRNPDYQLEVPENQDVTNIHTVVAMDEDQGDNGRITYSITGGNSAGKFSIDASSGRLSCSALDRESVSRYVLTVTAKDHGTVAGTGTCTVTVSVIDLNDNNPVFAKDRYELQLPEDIAVNTTVVNVTATDADTGFNADILYTLVSDTGGLFRINPTTGEIKTAGKFDREKKFSYIFTVQANDSGLYDPRSQKVSVYVTITDVNDNAPVFTQIPYNVNVSATLGVGEYVGPPGFKVQAEDKDEGSNGQVIYELSNKQYFDINLNTGRLIVKAPLVNAVKIHKLTVKATDRAELVRNRKSSSGVLNIRVGNPSTNRGSLQFEKLTYSSSILENTPTGTTVETVRAIGQPGDQIFYSFANGNDDHIFNIHNRLGYITVHNPAKLDYETLSVEKRIRLIVVASSNNPSSDGGYTTVWIRVLDQNDNTPRFDLDRYTTFTSENLPANSYVTKVAATDNDSGDNAHISYSIIAGACGPRPCGSRPPYFRIRPSGIIQTNIQLDRETIDVYRLIIQAKDNGSPSHSSTCTMKVTVADKNDNVPKIPKPDPVYVNEGVAVGSLIAVITANDVDVNTNPPLTYNFSADGNPNNTFSIDRYNGRISLSKPLDRETKARYLLKIQASDGPHTATQDLTVHVNDINDNRPEFLQDSYQKSLPEQTRAGVAVITVNATDKDTGENARITYNLNVAPVDGFYIDPNTGTIYTNKTITLKQPMIQLIVMAKDHGSNPFNAVTAVRIRVTDINDHSPVFTPLSYSAKVSEDEKIGSTIVTITAHDDDNDHDNSKIDYSISAGNNDNVFDIINNETVNIVLSKRLDRESVNVYKLKVIATDRGTPRRSSNTSVTINIDDINDSRPIFTKNKYTFSVNESIRSGVSIAKISATDADIGANGKVVYSIVENGNEDYLFVINKKTGELSVNLSKHLDHDTKTSHDLTVQAQDSGQVTQFTSYAEVHINVTDVNDHKPIFRQKKYEYFIPEDVKIGTQVFIAHAEDKDTGIYGKLIYKISQAGGNFLIDQDTGKVTTGVKFDYESTNRYHFKINASDLGGNQDQRDVFVNITSVDESAPVFSQTEYLMEVDFSAEPGTVIGRVEAVDDDTGPDGVIIYTFRYPYKHFKIDPLSGNITVKKSLRERRSVDNFIHLRNRRAVDKTEILEVRASSNRPNSLVNTAAVKITVKNHVASIRPSTGTDTTVTISVTVVFIALVIIVFVVVAAFLYRRNKRRNNQNKANHFAVPYDGSNDSVDAPPAPLRHGSLPYRYDPNHPQHDATTSEVSNQSASSGRGSADDGEDDDDEIRRITKDNAKKGLHVRGIMPDSGIQQDQDNLSDHSVQDHQEYLARLGIDTSKIKIESKPGLTSSVESMHHFEEEGGGEGDGLDIGYLVNAKLDQVEEDENLAIMDGTRQFVFNETEPSHAGSLSSVINSEEEFSGSYNWDYLLDWGPAYQPLAHVFSEIARLKDETIQPRKQPTKIVPQQPHRTSLQSALHTNIKTMPPPLLTNAPPVIPGAMPNGHMANTGGVSGSSNSTSSTHLYSARTSQVASLPSLPRSPISHESSFTTSPAFSPSFTPTLSPLATRSPSVSPLVTPHGGSSGNSTPYAYRSQSKHALTVGHSSESEQELRI